ncbi:23S rRNA (guanosine2251-2'-O)-methyltransferase [Tumebacillus permanentifrigoris]|uniref:23S rRNA (Guanosine2251-2'-O)-methyltransferase n=1 Tax=Tumebacillus permanentifrigoris TaxID=378543 RepID=A0A316D375_9BACL|nr:23S rRNA (guanosine2251-2'-O)-methyltransferase [Tumebacillus permanentifrigoris]
MKKYPSQAARAKKAPGGPRGRGGADKFAGKAKFVHTAGEERPERGTRDTFERGARPERSNDRPDRGGFKSGGFKSGGFKSGGRNDRNDRGARDDRRAQGFGGEDAANPNEQVEGRHPVLEALKSGRTINKILMTEGATGTTVMEILAKARQASVIVQTVPKNKLDQIADGRNHQGVIAYIAAKDYAELEDIIEAATNSPRPGLIIVLDEIEDPFNLGSILRTADGVGAHGVVIPKRRAVPLTATVAKASAGAIEHVPVARVANISQTIETLKKMGYWVVGTDVDGESMYHQIDMTVPIVMVIGNEGTGLGEAIKKRCDYLVRLPMIGQVQSLNAGVATGILLYEVLRQRGEKR